MYLCTLFFQKPPETPIKCKRAELDSGPNLISSSPMVKINNPAPGATISTNHTAAVDANGNCKPASDSAAMVKKRRPKRRRGQLI